MEIRTSTRALASVLLLAAAAPATAAPFILPAPAERPQDIAAATDPFLAALADRAGSGQFRERLAGAAAILPALGESGEDVAAAAAQRDQARSRLFPGLGLDVIGARTITRDLQSPSTQVENLSPLRRNDVIGTVDQLLTDFGATSARIRSGTALTDAARAELDVARNTALLQLVASWYDLLSAGAALDLSGANVARMQALSDAAALRFSAGLDSGGDVARARSYLAAAQSQQLGYQRRLRAAQARYRELFGSPADAVQRPAAPLADSFDAGSDRPELVSARARERAAIAALDAARADRLPRVDARISGSTYDVLRGTTPAYDVRAQVTMRQRFSTGGAEAARVAELAARRRAAGLAVNRIAAAGTREQSVAAAEAEGLAASLPALEAAYLDSRRARDLFAEQFRVSRGTLFDVLRAERDLLDTAITLAQTSYEADVARFTLLARHGGLIEHFGLTPAVTAAEGARR
jgi:adhesin transport system outer membrane protein